MMRWKIAFRNTFRNRRRTALNVFMIAGGVSAIIVFQGFAINLVLGLRETTIRTQTGHLQLATPAYWNKTAKTPKDTLVNQAPRLLKEISRHPRVRFATGKLSFYGLISQGENSLSARGVSFDPTVEGPMRRSFKFIRGLGFDHSTDFQVALGSGLATRLRARPRDRLTVLTNTYDGVVNALDLEVSGIFQTAISEFDDNTFLIPLKTAQKLMDTDKVEQIIIRLDRTENTDLVLSQLSTRLGPSVKLQPWYKLAKLYTQVANFNQVQNRIVEFIILSLILLAILNTIGMSIFERTGEIGTIAALGEKRSSIVGQFLMEGFILGLIGSLSGVVLGALLVQLVNAAELKVVMPGASTFFVIKIRLYAEAFRDAALLSVAAATVAAFIPALRASRMNIADALRRNV